MRLMGNGEHGKLKQNLGTGRNCEHLPRMSTRAFIVAAACHALILGHNELSITGWTTLWRNP
jgi:hypothetical protein